MNDLSARELAELAVKTGDDMKAATLALTAIALQLTETQARPDDLPQGAIVYPDRWPVLNADRVHLGTVILLSDGTYAAYLDRSHSESCRTLGEAVDSILRRAQVSW